MKKRLLICLSIALVFALLFPLAALAAQDVVAPEPKDETGDTHYDSASSAADSQFDPNDPLVWNDFPSLEDWGAEVFEDYAVYVYYLADVYYIYYMLYLKLPSIPSTLLWQAMDPSAESLEEFLDKHGITPHEYTELLELWVDILHDYNWMYSDEYYNHYRDMELERLGGTPGIVNVMYNGEFLKFNGAVPEIIGGVTFVPARVFFEALGAKVEYNEDSTITAAFDGFFIMFQPGDEQMLMMGPGINKVFPFNEAPYINDDGYAYIPVRNVAEALGLDVYWDSYYETVVIIDTAGLIAQIDADFTTLNKLLAMTMETSVDPDSGNVYKTTISVPGSMKMFDSLDGDKTAKTDADAVILTDGHSLNARLNMNSPELIDLILSQYAGYPDIVPEDDEMGVIALLVETDAELIFNYDDDMMYLRSPVFSSQTPGLPDGAWIAIGNASMVLSEVFIGGKPTTTPADLDVRGMSVGQLLSLSYITVEHYDYAYGYTTYNDYVHLYSYINDSAAQMKALLGDGKITVNKENYTISLSTDEHSEAHTYSGYVYSDIRFGLDIKIATENGTIKEVSGSLLYRENYYYGTSVTQYKIEFNISPDKVTAAIEWHQKNVAVMRFDIEIVTAEDKEASALLQAPPAGDKVFPIEDFLDDGYGEHNASAISQLAN